MTVLDAGPPRATRRRTPSPVAAIRSEAAPPAPEPGFAPALAALWRIAAQLSARAERDLATGERIEERDVKLATALAALIGKIRELETDAGNASHETEAGDRAGDAERLDQSILDALEAYVDGRAAALRQSSE